MAYDFAVVITASSDSAVYDLSSTSSGGGFYPVTLRMVNSCSSGSVYISLGSSTATLTGSHPLATGESWTATLACMDMRSRQAWGKIAVISTAAATPQMKLWASAV